jgi:hypothetical protein
MFALEKKYYSREFEARESQANTGLPILKKTAE